MASPHRGGTLTTTMKTLYAIIIVTGYAGPPLAARLQVPATPENQIDYGLSLPVKCRINSIKQSRVAEWFEQALHRALFE